MSLQLALDGPAVRRAGLVAKPLVLRNCVECAMGDGDIPVNVDVAVGAAINRATQTASQNTVFTVVNVDFIFPLTDNIRSPIDEMFGSHRRLYWMSSFA